ncbi:MAG: hypothetical protein C5B50_10210 [Verrucomicrobia bacterium]|nr:MAG: hypothetical protein C5B50_10210 [Verrucomicrobiota bacterium]
MHKQLGILFATASILTGCTKEADKSASSPTSTNASAAGPSALTAPVDYIRTVVETKQSAEKTVDTVSLNKAIQLFSIDKGRYPTNLDELVTAKVIPAVPTPPYGTKLQYDAASGSVSVVNK